MDVKRSIFWQTQRLRTSLPLFSPCTQRFKSQMFTPKEDIRSESAKRIWNAVGGVDLRMKLASVSPGRNSEKIPGEKLSRYRRRRCTRNEGNLRKLISFSYLCLTVPTRIFNTRIEQHKTRNKNRNEYGNIGMS